MRSYTTSSIHLDRQVKSPMIRVINYGMVFIHGNRTG